MIPILYATISEGTVPTDYGLGSLTDALSCIVTEERNGSYELVMEYPSKGIHAEDIEPNRFIKAKPNFTDNPQLFRIYKVGKDINGKFSVYGQHISYDLSGKIVPSGTTGGSATASVLALKTQGGGNFNITTDIVSSKTFKVDVPSSTRSWFGGKQGSLLDIYGGEWKYDNYTCSLLASRGTDRGVRISYGKNLTQLSQELDMSNLVTGVYGYAINPNTEAVTTGTKVSTGLVLDVPHDVAMDFSNDIDWESSTAIATQLATLTSNYISNNSASLIKIRNSITLDFVQMKDLKDRVDLCDTVHIFFEALGISATAKCIKTEWDVLEERYSKTTFGDSKTNIADTIAVQTQKLEITPTNSEVTNAVNRATELITGNLGGYVINGHDSNGDGYPDENLIMDTMDISTATKVIRSNLGGIGLSTSGYAGPYTTAITAEGIVATAITTGTLNADLIKAGTISDTQGNSTINMTNGVATMKSFTAKGNFNIINSTNSKTMGTIFPYAEGGAIQLNDSNQNGRANLFATNDGGYLYLYNSSGTRVVNFNAYGSGTITGNFTASGSGYFANNHVSFFSSTYGGNINVSNSSNENVVWNFVGSNGQGEVYVGDGSATNVYLHGGNGNITCVSLTQTSSRKVKENIKPIEDSGKILDLQAVSFDYKNKELGTNKRGFVAEEVAEVLPNLVSDGDIPSLDYVAMIPYLQDVIKKQEERIKALEDKIYGSN